jgi:hypothetical protein
MNGILSKQPHAEVGLVLDIAGCAASCLSVATGVHAQRACA